MTQFCLIIIAIMCLKANGIPTTTTKGSNKRLAECGMGNKIKAGCRMQEILRAEYGMKISWCNWEVLISIEGRGGKRA